MNVSAVSFNGLYRETVIGKYINKTVENELNQARPFLRELARDLPDNLHVNVYSADNGDTCLDVDYFISGKNKAHNIARTNQHTLSGGGFWLLSEVFCGLEKMNPELFEKTAKMFVKNLDRISIG